MVKTVSKLNLRILVRPTDKITMSEYGAFEIVTEKVLQQCIDDLYWEDIPVVDWDPTPEEYIATLEELRELKLNYWANKRYRT